MSKRKAEAASDFSDEDEEAPVTKKKVSGTGDNVVAFELSRNRKVVVKKFKGKVFVDVREFYTKYGEDLPSKKGILLSLEQWRMLQEHIEDVQEAIESLK